MEKSGGGRGEIGRPTQAMKLTPWLLGGVAGALVTGLIYMGAGLWRPGQAGLPETGAGTARSLLASAKSQAESLRSSYADLKKEVSGLSGLKGSEGEHRVFVSAQLVYLPKNAEPVQPLDRKMKTVDGIEVGWKIAHNLDPADPRVKDEDPDGDGFTNLEEFVSQTDPLRKEDSPAKESKLKSRSGDPVAMAVSFPEKSGGLYTVRFQVGPKRREFKGKVGDSFWLMAGADRLEIFTDEVKLAAARAKAREAGQNSHSIPLEIVNYQEKLERIKDAKAGGIEVDVDNSVLLLARKDALEEKFPLTFSAPQRPNSVVWDVGDIRLFTPASGGLELGPFRVGETFPFEGNEFSVVGRQGGKIELKNKTEPKKEPFWVPVENSPSAAPPGGG